MSLSKPLSANNNSSIICRVRIFALGSLSRTDDNSDEEERVELDAEWNQDTFETQTDHTELSSSDSHSIAEEVEEKLVVCVEGEGDKGKPEAAASHDDLPLPLLQSKTASEAELVATMLQNLSEQDLETAALTSYQYFLLITGNSSNANDACFADNQQTQAQEGGVHFLSIRRQSAAANMARRHLRANKGDALQALTKLKNTLQFRRDKCVDVTRQSFYEFTRSSRYRQRRISHYLGHPQGKLFVRGYDTEGHACVHCIPRNSPVGSEQDHLGCLLAFLYILEKAIACSERHPDNTDGMILVSVDLKGFQQKWHVPPMSVVREILTILRDHYPERLYRVYLMDAPFLFRYTWSILKPMLDPETRAKFQFVSGRFQRFRVFRESATTTTTTTTTAVRCSATLEWSQCMPYQHPRGQLVDSLNMEAFYKLAFDQAYDEQSYFGKNENNLQYIFE